MLLTNEEKLEYQERVIKAQEQVIMRLVRERDTPNMNKNDCRKLEERFWELVKERNELDECLQNAQNTILSLRLRNSTLEEICCHFNVSYPHTGSS